jgi:hypothetical protein
MEIGNGFLKFGHLLAGNIARNVPTILVTLVVVIRPLGPLAKNTDGSPVQALDLGDVLKD